MSKPGKKLKIAVQLDMLKIFDKPFVDHETVYKSFWSELMNIKYLRANINYTDFDKSFKTVLLSGYTDILSELSDILAELAPHTRKYRHNDRQYYDKLTIDPDHLSVTESLSKEEIYLFTKNAQGRILGLIVANIEMLKEVKSKTDKVEATLARLINKTYLNL